MTAAPNDNADFGQGAPSPDTAPGTDGPRVFSSEPQTPPSGLEAAHVDEVRGATYSLRFVRQSDFEAWLQAEALVQAQLEFHYGEAHEARLRAS